jgi:hypothetical protein
MVRGGNPLNLQVILTPYLLQTNILILQKRLVSFVLWILETVVSIALARAETTRQPITGQNNKQQIEEIRSSWSWFQTNNAI